MKKHAYRIILILSLLPYVYMFSFAAYSAVNGIGYTFIQSNTIYGFDGFLYGLAASVWKHGVFILLPACFTYQISYLVYRKKENKRNVWVSTAIVTGAVCILSVFAGAFMSIRDHMEIAEQTRKEADIRSQVSEMAEISDITIGYGSISNWKLFDTGYTTCTMFIHYNSKTVAFLSPSGYKEYTLLENTGTNKEKVAYDSLQYEIELTDPGRSIAMFSFNRAVNQTAGIELRMADGTVYSIDEIQDDYGHVGVDLYIPWT